MSSSRPFKIRKFDNVTYSRPVKHSFLSESELYSRTRICFERLEKNLEREGAGEWKGKKRGWEGEKEGGERERK
jgi:hypothetical protein